MSAGSCHDGGDDGAAAPGHCAGDAVRRDRGRPGTGPSIDRRWPPLDKPEQPPRGGLYQGMCRQDPPELPNLCADNRQWIAAPASTERRHCARSPSPPSSLSVTPDRETDVPGQPFTAAQWRSALPRRSRHGRLPGCGYADDPGLAPVSGPDPGRGRLRQLDRPGLSSCRSPLCRDRRSASPSGRRTPSGVYVGQRCQRHGGPEDPVGGMSGQFASSAAMYKYTAG
jgi:hypothetical protein